MSVQSSVSNCLSWPLALPRAARAGPHQGEFLPSSPHRAPLNRACPVRELSSRRLTNCAPAVGPGHRSSGNFGKSSEASALHRWHLRSPRRDFAWFSPRGPSAFRGREGRRGRVGGGPTPLFLDRGSVECYSEVRAEASAGPAAVGPAASSALAELSCHRLPVSPH